MTRKSKQGLHDPVRGAETIERELGYLCDQPASYRIGNRNAR